MIAAPASVVSVISRVGNLISLVWARAMPGEASAEPCRRREERFECDACVPSYVLVCLTVLDSHNALTEERQGGAHQGCAALLRARNKELDEVASIADEIDLPSGRA